MPAIEPVIEILGVDVTLVHLSPHVLANDHAHYQRACNRARVHELQRKLMRRAQRGEPRKPLLVARRGDGSHWILDGQHHAEAEKALGTERVPCYVVESPGWAQERLWFIVIQLLQGRPLPGPLAAAEGRLERPAA
jgi:hypothetical protein